jgi:predicted RNase H-like nuclease (RuvC/YqgF family)
VHIVTKILMVFCAVLSLVLAALTMAYTANAGALKASINAERNAASAARTSASAMVGEAKDAAAAKENQLKSMTAQLAQERSKVAQLEADNTDLKSQVTKAQADAQSLINQMSGDRATVQTQAKLISQYRDEVTHLRETMLDTEKRNIELTDKINDLSSAREVLEQNARALKEQLEETKLNLQAAQQTGGLGTGVLDMGTRSASAVRELPGPLVRAQVSETFKSAAGDDMVVINEGSNRGLKENVKMNVIRGDTFIATIVLTTVEPTRSVGKVSLVRTGAVQNGDTVLSRLD